MSKKLDFFFCEICNRNQVKNKRHIYSKKHRERLDFLLTRQNDKIIKLSTFLNDIKIINDDVEQPEIWCLFCKTTIKSSNSEIACKHIFLHLSYENHIDSINEFWKEQRPDKKKWKKEQFYIDKLIIKKFLEKSEEILNKKMNDKTKISEINSETISEINKSNNNDDTTPFTNIGNNVIKANIVKAPFSTFNENAINTNFHINNINSKNNINDINVNIPYRTVKAFGENLTCINILPTQKMKNNIHDENSVPIWLMDSSDSESDSEDERLDKKLNIYKKRNDNSIIGPSIDLYLNYKEKEKKNRLNPNRLGSTLDRDKKISKNWMPNFGGIWNSGPRSSTRKEFLNKLNKNKKK